MTADGSKNESRLIVFALLGGFVCLGITLTFFFIDGHHQDAGAHYLCSRWAFAHPELFVQVWARPLPTFLYAFPAYFGYQATQIFTVLICAALAWQTHEFTRDLKIENPWLVIPLSFAQPSLFLLFTEVMTEPLFALVFVIALRLHLRGRVKAGMFVASLLITIRPEGFFIGVLWGVWILFDKRVSANFFIRGFAALILASGVVIWSLAAYFITGDILYIKNSWPQGWETSATVFKFDEGLLYLQRLPAIVGVFTLPFFLTGFWQLLKRRELIPVTTSFLMFFCSHTVLRALGAFSSAGYARYFVCVAPCIAIITLVGWNYIFNQLLANLRVKLKHGFAAVIIILSLLFCLIYKEGESWTGDEGASWSRDAYAITEIHNWFQANPRTIKRFVYSQTYMSIIFGRDVMEQPQFTYKRDYNLKLLRESPSGTLVFWDARTGSNWYTLTATDIESAGYKKIYSKGFSLDGILIKFPILRFAHPRQQEFYLLYKE